MGTMPGYSDVCLCIPGYQWDYTLSICSPLCSAGSIYNAVTTICDEIPCTDSLCDICPLAADLCLNCTTGYTAINSICSPFCGDGIIIGT